MKRILGRGLAWVTLALLVAAFWGEAVQATPQPPSCTNIVANGSFETDAAWERPRTALQAIYVTGPFVPDGDGPLAGGRALRLGTLVPASEPSYSSARQVVNIPADAGYVELSLAVWLYSQDTDGGDRQEVLLLTDTGNIRAPLWRVMPAQHSPRWQRIRRDLTPFRGERLILYLNVFNDGDGHPSAMFVDDVQLLVCASAVDIPPSPVAETPTVTATPTATPTAMAPSPSPTPPPTADTPTPQTTATPPAGKTTAEPPQAEPGPNWVRPVALTLGLTVILFVVFFLAAVAVGRLVVQRLAAQA